MARIGGNEFAVLATATSDGVAEPLLHRFLDAARSRNAETGRPYELKVSIGATIVHPDDDCSIGELMDCADARMYEAKGRRGVMSYEL